MIDRINEDWKRKLLNQPTKLVVESQIAAEFSENAKLLKGIIKEFEISAKDSIKEITDVLKGLNPDMSVTFTRSFIEISGIDDSIWAEGIIQVDRTENYIVKYVMDFNGSYTVNVMKGTRDIWNGPANPNKIAEKILADYQS